MLFHEHRCLSYPCPSTLNFILRFWSCHAFRYSYDHTYIPSLALDQRTNSTYHQLLIRRREHIPRCNLYTKISRLGHNFLRCNITSLKWVAQRVRHHYIADSQGSAGRTIEGPSLVWLLNSLVLITVMSACKDSAQSDLVSVIREVYLPYLHLKLLLVKRIRVVPCLEYPGHVHTAESDPELGARFVLLSFPLIWNGSTSSGFGVRVTSHWWP